MANIVWLADRLRNSTGRDVRTIDGRTYIDGALGSATNADVPWGERIQL
mgnify:CR=1 FL=1